MKRNSQSSSTTVHTQYTSKYVNNYAGIAADLPYLLYRLVKRKNISISKYFIGAIHLSVKEGDKR